MSAHEFDETQSVSRMNRFQKALSSMSDPKEAYHECPCREKNFFKSTEACLQLVATCHCKRCIKGRAAEMKGGKLCCIKKLFRVDYLKPLSAAASSGLFRQGSLVLPSSMDLTAYIGTVAQVHPAVSPAGPRPVEG